MFAARNDGSVENVLVIGGTVPILYGGVQVRVYNRNCLCTSHHCMTASTTFLWICLCWRTIRTRHRRYTFAPQPVSPPLLFVVLCCTVLGNLCCGILLYVFWCFDRRWVSELFLFFLRHDDQVEPQECRHARPGVFALPAYLEPGLFPGALPFTITVMNILFVAIFVPSQHPPTATTTTNIIIHCRHYHHHSLISFY